MIPTGNTTATVCVHAFLNAMKTASTCRQLCKNTTTSGERKQWGDSFVTRRHRGRSFGEHKVPCVTRSFTRTLCGPIAECIERGVSFKDFRIFPQVRQTAGFIPLRTVKRVYRRDFTRVEE